MTYTTDVTIERGYKILKASDGWILSIPTRTWICDTLGEALDQLYAEEEKFPVGGE